MNQPPQTAFSVPLTHSQAGGREALPEHIRLYLQKTSGVCTVTAPDGPAAS
jgi:hypothetical protein